jgi:outer membrane protein TolC
MKIATTRSLIKCASACVAVTAAGIGTLTLSESFAQDNPLGGVAYSAQTNDYRSFDVSSVYDTMTSYVGGELADLGRAEAWWDQHVTDQQRRSAQPLPTDIHSLMYLALKYSNEIRIAAEDPVIRQTAIVEADSNFDWVRYLNTSLNDTNEPISNSLTTGDNSRFFNEETAQAIAGVRRNTRTGGQFDVSQRYGFQDNNSTFFVPANQATGQLTVSYSQPLLRGRGRAYNNSLVVLSQLDAGVAEDEFMATLQDHLLEITRSYWALYQERATLAQQTSLYLKTQDIVRLLKARQKVDAQRTQFVTASSALESRRSELIRARTAVINAETSLRGLINAPELNVAEYAELVPMEMPSMEYLPTDLRSELSLAIQNRPEVHAALKEIKASAIRLGVAQNELLPALNFVTEGYLSGLRGDTDFGGALRDQFTTGAPSYSVGLQYEMPIGNRLARSRMTRRRVEMRQLQRRYALALTAIETEVDIAVRELNTAYQEIQAKNRALKAAEAETETIKARWERMADGSGQSSLNLESLLRAQERVTEAEQDYTESLLTYNLGLINLKKATGTLLQTENVTVGKTFSPQDGPSLHLDKGPSTRNQGAQQMFQQSPEYSYDSGFHSEVINSQAIPQGYQGGAPVMTNQHQMLPQQPMQQPMPMSSGLFPTSAESSFSPGSIGRINRGSFNQGSFNPGNFNPGNFSVGRGN